MSNPNRVAGKIFFKVNSKQHKAKGSFTYNLGNPKREPVIGSDDVHGYSEMPQVPRIEGLITDSRDLDLDVLQNIDGATVTVELANGKTIALYDAWYAADGDVTTEQGEVQVLYHGLDAEEIKA